MNRIRTPSSCNDFFVRSNKLTNTGNSGNAIATMASGLASRSRIEQKSACANQCRACVDGLVGFGIPCLGPRSYVVEGYPFASIKSSTLRFFKCRSVPDRLDAVSALCTAVHPRAIKYVSPSTTFPSQNQSVFIIPVAGLPDSCFEFFN